MALGLTQQLPIDEKHTYARDFLNNNIAILLGGRVAEEIIFNEVTTGAGNDIERATDMARKMVCNWGMSDKMGPLSYGKKEEQIFLGREIAQHRDYSEATAIAIDEEVKNIIDKNHTRVTKILSDNREVLIRLSETLLERESLDADEIDLVMNNEELPPVKNNGNGAPVKTADDAHTGDDSKPADADVAKAENSSGEKDTVQPQ